MLLRFEVPGEPVGQPRPRFSRRTGRIYKDPKHPVHAWKDMVRAAASLAYRGEPLQGPLRLDLDFIFPRIGTETWKRKPMVRKWHAKTPDRDNVEKAFADALKGQLWEDDSQICDGRIRKLIGAGNESTRTIATLWTLEPFGSEFSS